MPELPEVETVVRGLRRTVLGLTISEVRTNAPASSIVVSPSFNNKEFAACLKDRRIEAIDRRGKNILMRLSGEVTLWVHLKMTGHFFYLPCSEPVGRHDLVLFYFDTKGSSGGKNSERCLRFNDYRRFGRLRLYRNEELGRQKGLADLGPEADQITADRFVNLCRSRSRMIKPALLDQSFVAGIGNIYADESLYFSRIHPTRLTSSLSPTKLKELHGHIRRILRKAIRLMGSSVDTYSGINGQPGQYQKYLKAYNNEGRPCSFCGTRIRREKIGSRSAHFCPRCQRKK